MSPDEPILLAAKELDLVINGQDSSHVKQLLAEKINEMIQTGFERLVSLLYRMDVDEKKLKQVLKENPGTDAGLIITDLIIERQVQKIKSREEFRQTPSSHEGDEEKW
jgi:hypothetical protein